MRSPSLLLTFLGSVLLGVLLFPSASLAAYTQTFTISAYYSPCPDQDRYATGSYQGDITLNGRGTNAADGTPVYFGMLAIPKTYSFGTQFVSPQMSQYFGVADDFIYIGHDRGGAIVPSGERNQAYDRLDVWAGWCEPGLKLALAWGKRDVQVTVYEPGEIVPGTTDAAGLIVPSYVDSYTIGDATYSSSGSPAVSVPVPAVPAGPPQLFKQDIWYLSEGDDVERLQEYLKELGYYHGEITGFYDDPTLDAVGRFQLDNGIVTSSADWGFGHTGPNTRDELDRAVSQLRDEELAAENDRVQRGLEVLGNYPDLNKSRSTFSRDLSLGDVGEDVRLLQEELAHLGYFGITPTGYYGELTQHAVNKLQQKWGIVSSFDDLGAGVFGTQTRSHLNELIESRSVKMSQLAYNRSFEE